VFFPPTKRKLWGGGVKSTTWEGHFVAYPSCKYCKDLIRCDHPRRKFNYCDAHHFIRSEEDIKIECPINGIPEGEE
jgi:hypothetical protein